MNQKYSQVEPSTSSHIWLSNIPSQPCLLFSWRSCHPEALSILVLWREVGTSIGNICCTLWPHWQLSPKWGSYLNPIWIVSLPNQARSPLAARKIHSVTGILMILLPQLPWVLGTKSLLHVVQHATPHFDRKMNLTELLIILSGFSRFFPLLILKSIPNSLHVVQASWEVLTWNPLKLQNVLLCFCWFVSLLISQLCFSQLSLPYQCCKA